MCGLGSGSGFTMRAWAFAGLAWPGGQARGLDRGLSPKTRPARAQAWARSGPSVIDSCVPSASIFYGRGLKAFSLRILIARLSLPFFYFIEFTLNGICIKRCNAGK
jgi:hypothetical protein